MSIETGLIDPSVVLLIFTVAYKLMSAGCLMLAPSIVKCSLPIKSSLSRLAMSSPPLMFYRLYLFIYVVLSSSS